MSSSNTPIISQKLCSVSMISKDIIATIPKEIIKHIRQNSKKVNVYSIFYQSRGLKIAGFIVEPKKKKRKLPCIIWNRGGSREFGMLKLGVCYRRLGDLAQRGYVVIASQYSGGSPKSEGVDDFGGDNVADVLNLRKVLQSWPGADATKIGMYGASRGGLMTYRALSLVKWIKAAVIQSGPTDEVSAAHFRKSWREHQIALFGKSKKEQIRRSALYWPGKIYKKASILIQHGTADWRVSVSDSIRMAEQLYKQRVPFRLVIYEGADHQFTEVKEESDRLLYDWFERYLKEGKKLPNVKLHGE